MTTLYDIMITHVGEAAIAGAPRSQEPVRELCIPREVFETGARAMKGAGARLVAEWGVDETLLARGFALFACYAREREYLLVRCDLPEADPTFPSLTMKYIPAFRFERQIHSLMGLVPTGHVHSDLRPWIKFEDWPPDAWPLRKSFAIDQRLPRVAGDYRWARATGEGVYEIPVGPVHAGIIEPGHFRFQAVGEDIINLEERLGYVHKGIEKRFELLAPSDGARLAGRVSGDSTVGHALTYCRALEALCGCQPPERALWLRALFLELERIANHLGDIGAIANDAAFAIVLFQLSRLKERLLRLNHKLFGHRYLMDRIVPGGVSVDLPQDGADRIEQELSWLGGEFERIITIYDESPSLEDRLRSTGILTPELALELGTVGYVARASGQHLDCRIQTPFPPYDRIQPREIVLNSCDVHARAWVRVEEIRDSLRLIIELLDSLPSGEISARCGPLPKDSSSFSVVEGWRGEIVYWLQSGAQGEINRCMIRDPSSVNWLGLEQAVLGNIVPDFPLCNKSFNQSYSGNDL
ncbi:formate hydrogenlyase subunit 5 [Geobacter sp. OR-1]|uniref:hydrogenase large subunit n=1 Tax=Geobacter sp. OR-1 TaxID=1266765 RepID=UPI000541F7BD|nr:NADH-quinone oxidoreductase subunit C [Geobacter sp. OR-1]GAM11775.1 formate hydrogenlyase subunit 5 [Geobacter sp. OR-1]